MANMRDDYAIIIQDIGEQNTQWEMIIYRHKENADGYFLCDYDNEVLRTILTEEEVERLTLGLEYEEGGDHMGADHFLIDSDTFLDTYSDIPQRITETLNQLPEYEPRKTE